MKNVLTLFMWSIKYFVYIGTKCGSSENGLCFVRE